MRRKVNDKFLEAEINHFILYFRGRLKFEWIESLGPVLSVNFRNKKYLFCVCHRRPDRSIYFFGLERYFCARCCGILTGTIIGVILRLISIQFGVLWGILLIVPLLIDGFTQFLGFRESTNQIRVITGLLFSIGLICLDVRQLHI